MARRVLALVFLLLAGFVAGYGLSWSGSINRLRAQVTAATQPGGGSEQAAVVGSGRESGGGGGTRGGFETSGGHAGGMMSGGGGGAGMRPTLAAAGDPGGGGEATKMGSSRKLGDDRPPATPSVTEDPLAILAGNTLEPTDPAEGRARRFLSAAGWQAERTGHDFVVHRWTARSDQLCVLAESHTLCDSVSVTKAEAPRPGTGATLGTLATVDGRRWTIRRGDVLGLPTVVPLILGGEAVRPVEDGASISARDGAALKSFLARTMVRAAEKDALVATRFEPDGRWLEARPTDPDARSGTGGVRLSIGRWFMSKDVLCLDKPGLELTRVCYHPEQWGAERFRLRPTGTAAAPMLAAAGP